MKEEVVKVKKAEKREEREMLFNPLLSALKENDKKNLFKTNVNTAFIKTGFPLIDYYFGAVVNKHDDKGELIKQEPRIGQAAGTFNLVIGNSGSGKMQPDNTPVPTPTGWTTIGDLKPGDEVFAITGQRTKVLGVYPHGEQDVYKITFSDGRTAMCGLDHLWHVSTYGHGRDMKYITSTEQMISDYKDFSKPDNPVRRYRIPTLMHPVKYEERPVPVDPYIVGAMIGNGCLTLPQLTISCGTDFVPTKIAEKLGCYVKYPKDGEYRYVFYRTPDLKKDVLRSDELFADLPEVLTYSGSKEIPEVYLHNSEEVRRELLRGLMDTDGSITMDKVRFNVTYSSTSKKLLEQIQELIRSLGYNANISEDKRSDKYTTGFCGTLVFLMPNEEKHLLFTEPKKYERAKKAQRYPKRRNYEYLTVEEIKLDHREPSTCIYIEHPSHMYVTDQFIPTHNTTLVAQIAGNIIHQFPFANVIHFDCENRFDVSRAETITKLPPKDFNEETARYIIKNGMVGLDIIQKMITDIYKEKMKLKDQLMVDTGLTDEFGKPVMMMQPTVVIIDSITTVMAETFSPDNAKDMAKAEELRSNTEGARDAKTMKGFFKDILPMCKEANIIIYGINHINTNMSMNSILPVAKQQNWLGQNESIPGGKTMIYYPFNIMKLIPKTTKVDRFEESIDGFDGHLVRIEPIKSSSNQSGNGANGLAFDLVFSFKQGFDPLRSMILYGKNAGLIEGNKNKMKFKDDPSFTFTFRDVYKEKDKYPIWKNIVKYVIPHLDKKLSYTEPSEIKFDEESLSY